MKKCASLFILFLLFFLPSFADITLPSVFSDNMVLQRNTNAAIWGWATPSKTITVTSSWNKKKYTVRSDATGKWKLTIQTPDAGGPYQLIIDDGKPLTLNNILIGEVWICSGQSNMEMPLKGFRGQPIKGSNEAILHSKNKQLRLYTVPRSGQLQPQENSKPSLWKEAEPEAVSNFSATAYYFGKLLNELLDVPIGLINVSYGGSTAEAWMDENTLKAFPEIVLPGKTDSIKIPNRTPTLLFNGMLHPVIGYGMKGVIWYQGESNYERADQYESLFPALISNWRSLWQNGEFPFYYAQIAPYNYAQLPPYRTGGKYNSAFIRDAQRKSLDKISNSGMAVLMDAGEENSIHPANKKAAGERLAMLALAKTYGLKGFGFESPLFDSLFVTGNIAEVRFRSTLNGLTAYGKELSLFEIAGKDKIFYPAKAVISRNSVMLSSPQVKEPVAVRYAFRDFVTGDLFSTEGLPVSSFRTDNWDQ
ncbi:MAG: sialate O-acetylesterase [Chitinophagaceae bacterium]